MLVGPEGGAAGAAGAGAAGAGAAPPPGAAGKGVVALFFGPNESLLSSSWYFCSADLVSSLSFSLLLMLDSLSDGGRLDEEGVFSADGRGGEDGVREGSGAAAFGLTLRAAPELALPAEALRPALDDRPADDPEGLPPPLPPVAASAAAGVIESPPNSRNAEAATSSNLPRLDAGDAGRTCRLLLSDGSTFARVSPFCLLCITCLSIGEGMNAECGRLTDME
mmetsp:Transcript_2141/g.4869  ORF Transcript_2141/g.4869 Transcript_2141/m.4869 type:complete len:222 (+) Transcript_2141:426-1091(+)